MYYVSSMLLLLLCNKFKMISIYWCDTSMDLRLHIFGNMLLLYMFFHLTEFFPCVTFHHPYDQF